MFAPSLMKRFVKALLTRPFGRRPATVRNLPRPRLGWEVFEDRVVPVVTAIDITAITAAGDVDGGIPNHVTVQVGTPILVEATYSTDKDKSAVNGGVALSTGTPVQPPLSKIGSGGTDVKVEFTIDTTGLEAGVYNLAVFAKQQGSAVLSDEVLAAVDLFVVTVIPTQTTVTGGTFTYDGNPHPATDALTTADDGFSTTPTVTYYDSDNNPLAGPPVDAGTYTVVAAFAGNEDYGPSSASAPIVIEQATSETTITGGTFTYDGEPHPATGGSVTGAGGLDTVPTSITYFDSEGNELAGPPVDAGTYTVVATYEGDANHTGSSAEATIVIQQAESQTTIEGGTFTYDGEPHPATGGSVTGAGGLDTVPTSITYFDSEGNELAGPPVDAGTYTVVATYEGDANHTGSSAEATIVIEKAASETTVEGGTFLYDGNPHPATGSVTGAGGLDTVPTITYFAANGTQLAGPPVNVGTYTAVASYEGDANHTGSSAQTTIVIQQAALEIDGTASGAANEANLAKAKKVSFQFKVVEGLATSNDDLQALFQGAKFTLSIVGGTSSIVTNAASISEDGTITLNVKIKRVFRKEIRAILDAGGLVTFHVTAVSSDGNYLLDGDPGVALNTRGKIKR